MNRILLVEDNAAIIRGLTYTLEHEHFEVDSAGTTEKAKALVEQKRYDLALLDIMLPDGTGYEVCRELRVVSPDSFIEKVRERLEKQKKLRTTE